MTIITNVYKTYEVVGIREDLSDIVTNISPVDTQFYTSLGETTRAVKNTKHEWLTDTLAAAAENKQLEGDTRTAAAQTAATRVYNMHQIQAKTFAVSDTAQVAEGAGNVNNEDYLTTKNSKALARDIEYAFLKEVRADGSASVERTMRGVCNWIITNVDKAGDATLNADGTITGGTSRALTSTLIKNMCQTIWSAGGSPTLAYCGGYQKMVVSSFAQTNNYRTAVEGKKLDDVIDIYVNDFCILTVKPHRLMDTDVMIILDMDYWHKVTYRPSQKREMAKTGDGRVFDITVEHTLESNAETASGRIATLATS